VIAQLGACAGQPGPHRPRGQFERRGDLLVGQVSPRVQEQDIALLQGKHAQGLSQAWRDPCGKQLVVDVGSRIVCVRFIHESGFEREHVLLGTPVRAQQVRGDSVQPRQQGATIRVEGPSSAERDRERLRGQVIGDRAADPAGQELVDRTEVRGEGALEPLGFDDRVIRSTRHVTILS
jgi:hypothetical protein